LSDIDRPRLRPVEAIPIDYQGRRALCLRDPFGLSESLTLVFEPLVLALGFLDGQHTLQEAHARLGRVAASPISLDELRRMIHELDEQYLLEGPRSAAREVDLLRSYRLSPARGAAMAGSSYPAEPAELRGLLESFYQASGGPGGPPREARDVPLAAALAPHVDLWRGGPCFAQTYRRVAEDGRARRFVVFGTGHVLGGDTLVAATAKDFATPLGTVPCDRLFLQRLQGRLDFDLYADELTHRNEHSIEFQALYLAHLFGGRRDITLVPILCGSFHRFVAERRSPASSARVESFVAALRETLAELGDTPTCLLGGVDLAHVGPQYGDPAPVDASARRRIELEDRRMLEPVLAADAERFFATVAADGDRRRICGLSSIYLMLRSLDAPPGELLAYAQVDDPTRSSVVSFASVVYPAFPNAKAAR
jgi:MEMO1 family protein